MLANIFFSSCTFAIVFPHRHGYGVCDFSSTVAQDRSLSICHGEVRISGVRPDEETRTRSVELVLSVLAGLRLSFPFPLLHRNAFHLTKYNRRRASLPELIHESCTQPPDMPDSVSSQRTAPLN